jgi:hypothetical protein
MQEQYLMIAAAMANTYRHDLDNDDQNPLSTREMAAVQQPSARFAPIAALRNRLSRR